MKKTPLILTFATFSMASFVSLYGQTEVLDTVRGVPTTGGANDGVNAYAGSLDSTSYTSFVSRLESAFDSNTGGTMVTGSWSSGTRTELVANFGTDLSRSISFTTTVTGQGFTTVSSSSFEPLYGSRAFSDQSGALSDFGFSIGSITDTDDMVLAGWGVTEFGFTALSRTSAEYPIDLRVTATYSDTTSSSLLSTLGATKDSSDTFYHFAAPEGTFITGITMESLAPGTENPALTRIGFDHVGFITAVPEPQTFALLAGLFGLGIAAFHRRSRS